ncbi:MAG: glycosyltransferase [Sneathiellaceae bacterium]
MRIAVFAHEFPALSETFVLNQVTGLIDLGHEVTVFADGPRAEPLVHPDVGRYGLAAQARYPGIPKGKLRRALHAVPRVCRLARRHPRRLARSLDFVRHGREAASGRLLYWSARLAAERPFDAILAHFGPMGEGVCRLRRAGLIAGPVATVIHGVDISVHDAGPCRAYRHLLAEGDLLLPISEVWHAKLLRMGADPGRTIVHHMGVDPRLYAYRERLRPAGRPVQLLTVGRLVEKKGVAVALQAVADLVAKGMDVRYQIVGDGPLMTELCGLRDRLGLGEVVRFLGWQDQVAVSALMERSDILLTPSLTAQDGDQEGIPVTLMEAMASGMLVVASRHSGIPELIADGSSGILVPEGCAGALATAVAGLLHPSGPDWHGFSRAARATVARDFDISILNRALAGRLSALAGR